MAGSEARVIIDNEVVLDFAGLFSTAGDKPQEKPTAQRESPSDEPQPQGIAPAKEAKTPAKTLIRKAEREADERERSAEICRQYQDHIRAAEGLRSSILKGTKAGEDVYSLFLQAAKAISLMTSDTLFYDQIEADLITIYGYQTGEKNLLQRELSDVRIRLQKLKETEGQDLGREDRQRIQVAIRQHESRIEELEKLIG